MILHYKHSGKISGVYPEVFGKGGPELAILERAPVVQKTFLVCFF